jgi:hypothetical protein
MLSSIFSKNWFQIDVVFKNGVRNALGRLVNAVEDLFFEN